MAEDRETAERFDPSAANYRRLGMVFLFLYLVFPTAMRYAPTVSPMRGASVDVGGLIETYQLLFFLMAAFVLVLAFARKRGRDWKALDRGFGALLLAAGVMMAFNAYGFVFSGFFQDMFTQTRWFWFRHFGAAVALLCVLAGLCCRWRVAWAVIPLALLIGALGWLSWRPIEGDSPEYLRLKLRSEFFLLAGIEFLTAHHTDTTPEEVTALFGGLDAEANAALRAWVGDDVAKALIEEGDDAEYHKLAYLRMDAYVDRAGNFRMRVSDLYEQSGFYFFFHLDFTSTKFLFVSVLLYAIWRGYRQRYERKQAASVA